ncbi:c-type cytochrome [Candidatus Venteria ishoeyi]|uniref:Cytochrome c n=1 Tax=Candidatus Venteria ishoeyi TaxID=1899563 RepID=A0A1H6FGP9_9GAMM|nr:cytochrome c [Candidatus Venteria ishoeyi]MDM8548147.1 cytochrome c [Candidatus Venteria ishoeyi]SEH09207.1 Cytochrome c' precursor [Candidatus Venteria ishoeyi]SEH09332.1 Cytochrome c' precursor [Candidatus Venteria ishoeyi]
MMIKKILLMTASLTLLSSNAIAEEIDAEAYIKYREHLMENAKHHAKGIANILKGKLQLKDNLLHHARALHEVSQMFSSAFPEGSDFGETSAKSGVWENKADFNKAAKNNQQATAALVTAAESGDLKNIGNAMAEVGKSCKACHKEYRSKK